MLVSTCVAGWGGGWGVIREVVAVVGSGDQRGWSVSGVRRYKRSGWSGTKNKRSR